MPDESQKDDSFELRVRRTVKRGQPLRIVEISYVPTPDADRHIAQVIDLILRAAGRKRSHDGKEMIGDSKASGGKTNADS